jgi:hypothetical protein
MEPNLRFTPVEGIRGRGGLLQWGAGVRPARLQTSLRREARDARRDNLVSYDQL